MASFLYQQAIRNNKMFKAIFEGQVIWTFTADSIQDAYDLIGSQGDYINMPHLNMSYRTTKITIKRG